MWDPLCYGFCKDSKRKAQPSICTSQGNNLDACPIRTHLEVVERAVSYEVTVQVFFPHKCNQFNWCSALIMEVVVTFPDISPFRCLHDSVVFPKTLLFSVGSYIKYSRGAFAPRDPRSVDKSAFFSLDLLFIALVCFLMTLTSSILRLGLHVKLWLTYEWIFDYPQIGPMALK